MGAAVLASPALAFAVGLGIGGLAGLLGGLWWVRRSRSGPRPGHPAVAQASAPDPDLPVIRLADGSVLE